MQDVLTEIWTSQTEPIQLETPASFVVQTLREVLQSKLHLYLFVDLCSGAGGPTPYIESEINGALIQGTGDLDASHTSKQDADNMHKTQEDQGVEFILTDLHPYNLAWQNASKASKSGNLRYIPVPVDASLLTKEALGSAVPPRHATSSKEAMVFRLFSLAFHQFDDELATKILDDTLQTSKGICYFRTTGQGRRQHLQCPHIVSRSVFGKLVLVLGRMESFLLECDYSGSAIRCRIRRRHQLPEDKNRERNSGST